MTNRLRFFLLLLIWLPTSCANSPETQDKKASAKVDKKAIRKAIRAHTSYLSNCYGQSLLIPGNELKNGIVKVQFEIGSDGRAQKAKVLKEKSSLQSDSLNECILSGLKSWDFPVHPEGLEVSVVYPFFFKANPPAKLQQKLDRFEKIRQSKKQ